MSSAAPVRSRVRWIHDKGTAVKIVRIDHCPDGPAVCAPVELGVTSAHALEPEQDIRILRIDSEFADIPAGKWRRQFCP